MRDALKEFFKFCMENLRDFPIISSILIFILLVYLVVDIFPRVYKKDNDSSLYSYYNKLGVVVFFIVFCVIMLLIQLTRIIF